MSPWKEFLVLCSCVGPRAAVFNSFTDEARETMESMLFRCSDDSRKG